MNGKAFFVDLSNFYSRLLESGIDDPRILRDYFLNWLDFDLLAENLAGESSSVWVFHSGRKFGPKSNRIQDEYLTNYIDRINSLKGVTARDVDIEGSQRESATYECEKCAHQGVSTWESEKGIDASLIVHLFDTMDSWDVAYLLSGDADFVPAVASLRRRGKIVMGAGFPGRSSALMRECYDYVDLAKTYLRADVFAYRIFGQEGAAKRWLTDDVEAAPNGGPTEFSVEWQPWPNRLVSEDGRTFNISQNGPGYRIFLLQQGSTAVSNRIPLVEELRSKYPGNMADFNAERRTYQFFISRSIWAGTRRRLEEFRKSIDLGSIQPYRAISDGEGFKIRYEINGSTGKYEAKTGVA